MNEKFDVVIIDIFNLYYRMYYIYERMVHKFKNKELEIGGIYGTLIYLKKFLNDYLKDKGKVYIASDNFSAKINMRKLIDNNYKANRKKENAKFYKSLEYLILILMNFADNYYFVQKVGIEADDFLPALILNEEEDKKFLLLSKDLDWARCINYSNYNVFWHNGKNIVKESEFHTKYGFYPSELNILNYKVFKGDRSDNIPVGVPNLPKSILIKLLEQYNDLYSILENLEIIDFVSNYWKKKIKENEKRLKVNYQLVNFIKINKEELKNNIVKCSFKPNMLIKLYDIFGIPKDFDSRVFQLRIDLEKKEKIKKNKEDSVFHQPFIPRVN